MNNLITAAKKDITVFARELLGHELWPHQVEMLTSPKKLTLITAGRQVGKSWALATLALWWALRNPRCVVLLVSAGEVSAMRLLALCARLAASTVVEESVDGETMKKLSLSNGSVIYSAPASERSIRGESTSLLIVDEAALVDDLIFTAALPGILARGGSRVICCSTPWGPKDRWFGRNWRLGMRGEDSAIAGFHWPSSVSPMIDDEALDLLRRTLPAREFRQEVEAVWLDDEGAYFSGELLQAVTLDYPLLDLERDGGAFIDALGVDWGGVVDPNAMVGVARREGSERAKADTAEYAVVFAMERKGSTLDFVEEVVRVCGVFRVRQVVSEVTGVGRPPTQLLQRRLAEARVPTAVVEVDTTARSKVDGFGAVSLFFEQGRLWVPSRYPELPRQLGNLEVEALPSGLPRIAVPAARGHDDVAMALMMACAALDEAQARNWAAWQRMQEALEVGPGSITKVAGACPISGDYSKPHYEPGDGPPKHNWPGPGGGW